MNASLSRPPDPNLRSSKNPSTPPADFEHFWTATLSELAEVAPRARSVAHPPVQTSEAVLSEFDSLGDVSVRCWLSGPHRVAGNSGRPLLVTSHGYGGQVDVERVRRLSRFGFDVVGVDARGVGRSENALGRLSPYGYLMTGSETPESSILRGAICDFLQAYRAAVEWFGRPTHVTFQGFSFAGGLSFMSAALLALARKHGRPWVLPAPEVLAIGAPTFGYLDKRLELCDAGSGKELALYLQEHPRLRERVLRVFSYFDTTFFAPYLDTDVGDPRLLLAGVGTFDPVVPAETVYAIFNALPRNPVLFEFPCSHTSFPEEAQWVKWEACWIRAAREGGSARATGTRRD